MCGVVGVWGSAEEKLVKEILGRISHRGPDGFGVHCDPEGRSALGHRRLAIVDPPGGSQPILSSEPRVGVVVNGEIYNHLELRRSLGEARFRTRSDSESVLQLYLQDERDLPWSLDGMYAFVLQDRDDLFVARDPLGIKPLYMGKRPSGWCFASEIKGLVGFADGIQEFPPGTTFHTARGFEKFYSVPELSAEPLAEEEASAELREGLERGVVKRLMSDVPVGVLLSGELDSSLVAALARPHIEPLHTFAVGLEGSEDLAAARHVASYLDTVHHEYVLTADDITLQLACEDLLPSEILWREKKQFDEGSGTTDLLPLALEDWVAFLNTEAYMRAQPEAFLRSPEECVYHALLRSVYPETEPVLRNVARWSHRPEEPELDLTR